MALTAIISGGGIGGLATATALARKNWQVTVYESRPEVRVAGSGIYLWGNGLGVLRALGAFDDVMGESFWPTGMEKRESDGTVVLPAGSHAATEVVCVKRSHLMMGLERAALDAGVRIATRTEVVGARADGTLEFVSNDRATADLAIGCDGVWSPTRKALGLESSVVQVGEGALRCIVRCTQGEFPESDRGKCIEMWRDTRRLLVTPVSPHEVYLAMTCKVSDIEARNTRIGDCWLQDFPEWAWLIERARREPVLWNDYAVVKCKAWSSGRTAILGDSAHAQPPNLGQGGGTALYNGLALAAYMANVHDRRDVPDALAAWEARVRPLTDLTQHWSTLWLEFTTMPREERIAIARAAFQNNWVMQNVRAAANAQPIVETEWHPAGGQLR